MQRFLDRLGGNGPSFVGTKWTWRDGALWHLTTYASGWQEWKTFDEVAQSWHWVTQADKEALKDCAFARQLFLEQFFWHHCLSFYLLLHLVPGKDHPNAHARATGQITLLHTKNVWSYWSLNIILCLSSFTWHSGDGIIHLAHPPAPADDLWPWDLVTWQNLEITSDSVTPHTSCWPCQPR